MVQGEMCSRNQDDNHKGEVYSLGEGWDWMKDTELKKVQEMDSWEGRPSTNLPNKSKVSS